MTSENNQNLNLLAIETSCDETAICILNFKKEQKVNDLTNQANLNFSILSNHILSQINLHRPFGGVFPNLAKREHAKNIVRIFIESLKEANLYTEKENQENFLEKENLKIQDIKNLLEKENEMLQEILNLFSKIEKPNLDFLAITSGPGLSPALWIGINFAKAISIFWDIKIYPINHLEGHIMSSLVEKKDENKYQIKNIFFPTLCLLISGGHTEIIFFENWGKYKKIGQTIDDAIGEAFDKVARSLSLPYPGGPEISKIADEMREKINTNLEIKNKWEIYLKNYKLPRPLLNTQELNFSFSGLKTAVINNINKLKKDNFQEEEILKYTSLDFENATAEILLKKIKKSIEKYNASNLLIGGGVIANNFIRKSFIDFSENEKINLFIPEKFLTGDNAFMIGLVAMREILEFKNPKNILDIKADSNFSVENI